MILAYSISRKTLKSERHGMKMEVKFYKLNEIEDHLLKYAVIASHYKNKWIYCKHKERDTWEIPGGRREDGETIIKTAKRELFEETGAIEYQLQPLSVYSVNRDRVSYGLLCYAEITKLDALPESEIERIEFFDVEPSELTYPEILPKLFEAVKELGVCSE